MQGWAPAVPTGPCSPFSWPQPLIHPPTPPTPPPPRPAKDPALPYSWTRNPVRILSTPCPAHPSPAQPIPPTYSAAPPQGLGTWPFQPPFIPSPGVRITGSALSPSRNPASLVPTVPTPGKGGQGPARSSLPLGPAPACAASGASGQAPAPAPSLLPLPSGGAVVGALPSQSRGAGRGGEGGRQGPRGREGLGRG